MVTVFAVVVAEESMLSYRIFLYLFLVPTLLQVSCGRIEENHLLDFRLYFDTKDSELKNYSEDFIRDYNEQVGFTAITWVDTPEEANSTATFSKGLFKRTTKIGLGQWVADTKSDFKLNADINHKITRTVNHSMSLEFDVDYVKDNIFSDSNSDRQAVYTLFCHEIGHGLQMSHTNDSGEVMYVSVEKGVAVDYDKYFQNVRDFFEKKR